MSKKNKQISSKVHQNSRVQKKKEFWIQMKKTKKKKSQLSILPKDPKQFSCNWKALQEILKSNKTTTNEPKAAKQQPNGHAQEKKVKPPKTVCEKKTTPSKTDSGKKAKLKSVSKNQILPDTKKPAKDKPKSVSKNPILPDTKKPATLKRKKTFQANGEQAAKKQKFVKKDSKPTEEDIWFDDVDPDDIEATIGEEAAAIMRKKQGVQKKDTDSKLVKEHGYEGLTKAIAMDCEMVGVGPDGEESILARVSLVNQYGKCVYDKYAKPTEEVTDYRTAVSGIRKKDIINGEDVATVRKEVAEILQGRIVVGHALHNDFKILLLDHPKKKIRDTQKYLPYRKALKTKHPSLKVLCKEVLNVKVQQGEHSSVQDAQATMRLYTLVKKQWEAEIKKGANEQREKRKPKPKLSKTASKPRVAGLGVF
ncbi:RNA exonuclease 4 [Stigmatopora argus]